MFASQSDDVVKLRKHAKIISYEIPKAVRKGIETVALYFIYCVLTVFYLFYYCMGEIQNTWQRLHLIE